MRNVWMFLLVVAWSVSADTLTMSNGKTLQGMLREFKNQSFHFQEFAEERPTKVSANSVKRLRLSEATECDLVLGFDKKKQKVTLRGFKQGVFQVVVKGRKQSLRAPQVASLELPFNLQKFIAARDAQADQEDDDDEDKPKDYRASVLIVKGKATILHFDDGSAASKRQGNLCERMAKGSKGAIEYVRVNAKPDAPAVKKNRLKTTPQFWFFDRKGDCHERLADRFAEEDIEKAAEQIRR